MKRRAMLAGAAALVTLLVCLILPRLLPPTARAGGELSLWYALSECDGAAMEALAARCAKETGLTLHTRAFPDEQALAAACAGEKPELLWCSHLRASEMARNGALTPLPEGLAAESGVEGFCTLGSRLPVLLRNPTRLESSPADLETLLSVKEKDVLAASCWADLLYEAMFAQGRVMTGQRTADSVSGDYVRLHNLLARAAFDGAAVNEAPTVEAVRTGGLAAAVVDSMRLVGEDLTGLTVEPLPLPKDAPRRYAAVRMGFARMGGGTAADSFLRWIAGQKSGTQSALSLGLVPLRAGRGAGKSALEQALLTLSREAELSALDPGCSYLRNRDACEEGLRLSLDLLA